MDFVSQLILGAVVTVALLGRRMPVWQAALVGVVCGTLPDLDMFIDRGDAISNMTQHRTESHSLLWLTLISPLLACLLWRIFRQPSAFARWWTAVWLALMTHPLLDLTTIYGTQLALPFTDRPFAIGCMSVTDPLYTLPLLVGLIAALIWRNRKGWRCNSSGLIFSCLYLAWSMAAQTWVIHVAHRQLLMHHGDVRQLLVTPTAFNTLQWRIMVVTPESYLEGFYSLLNPLKPLVLSTHARGWELYQQYSANQYVQRVAWFSRGFFAMKKVGNRVEITDLRIGEEAAYPFSFDLGTEPLEETPGKPERVSFKRLPLRKALDKLWSRF
ncbi:metal-dependent hydrolase [Erwinia pyrifoliae]|uniref:Metal-dependent hydrolase n=1 Tax=Erwinia pyrifoliae TaxID=79967 RepID=A0ABY5X433_ERWPY|nr:metal-dependent hydrolase [Erwinia pyrifoliae]AUX72332.1 metal-dependent hydrolase [Erwinia pyrifoliae]MCA8877424.1 metal-dependent hydrolase [Erwinia pyrifoliae]MCT2388584.1 metal-dependent hydrolase [Erwinia pyrifoliae]MCU8586753.1 metal-dependent hydrolase [Erwinia pyrifoliae]UWS30634.1 metal-dependent hydrolase [Erwinia pyrifoliae]